MSSEAKVVGYCRACGKALDATAVRTAQGTIYCEEHAPMTMDNPQTVPPIPAPVPMIEGAYPNPYTAPVMPPPVPRNDISPGVAFGLGLIPGVGAIYNGQYAKGVVHVVIVGLMISILSNGAASGYEVLISLLLAAFWAYMCFEAFHTAKRRQQGLVVDEFSSLFPMRGNTKFPAAPVVFIALGVVLLLQNLDLLDLRRAIRYWPVLLIALGAYMLFVRMSPGDASAREKESGR